MITAQLSDKSREEQAKGLGCYSFEVLPRIGDILSIRQEGVSKWYEVINLAHIIIGPDKPPLIFINLRQDTSAPAFRKDDIDAMFAGSSD